MARQANGVTKTPVYPGHTAAPGRLPNSNYPQRRVISRQALGTLPVYSEDFYAWPHVTLKAIFLDSAHSEP